MLCSKDVYIPFPLDLTAFQHTELHSERLASQHQASSASHPTALARLALIQWNHYLATKEQVCAHTFLEYARQLVDAEKRIGEDVGGWPLICSDPNVPDDTLCLSALTQGLGLAVLMRAYQLTCDSQILAVAERVVKTFELDILDGGVCAPFEQERICFEERAIYPASHALTGFLCALCGLSDYVQMTSDHHIEKQLTVALATLHALLEEFDAGFWLYSDLLERQLASPEQVSLNAQLLEILAGYSGCKHCEMLAARWQAYRHHWSGRTRYWFVGICARLGKVMRRKFQHIDVPVEPLRVCIAVPAFPVLGGIQTFLAKIDQVMRDDWSIEYLTQHSGPGGEAYNIQRFGTRRMTPLYFPFVWLYVLAGFKKLVSLMLTGAGYHIFLPQDGLYTSAFMGLAARLTGTRVVCIDHGDLSLFIARNSQLYRHERLREVMRKPWPYPVRLSARLLLSLYWPSRLLLARIAARSVDHYLIPGAMEDGVNEICQQLGIRRSCVTRFSGTVDVKQHFIPDSTARAERRARMGIGDDAMVVAIVCRLSAEKGLGIALEALRQALAARTSLCPELRVVIVGDGPMRKQIKQTIDEYGLNKICMLWGEASRQEVIDILGISDVFLYTSTRGAGFPLAVLEAMASQCAVIATAEPVANVIMLAEGRGISVPPGDVEQITRALTDLLQDRELCQAMGRRARAYVAQHHGPVLFRRFLQRATHWSLLHEMLVVEEKYEHSVE